MRYIFNLFRLNLLRWKTSLRIIMLLLIIPVIQLKYVFPYLKNVNALQMPMHVFEPYIASFSSMHSSLLISIIVVFILADVPIRHQGFELSLIRGSKQKWLLSQWLYIIFCAFLICSIIALFNIVVSLPFSYIQNEWSIPAHLLAMNKTATGYSAVSSSVPQFILYNDLPIQAFIYTFLLQMLLFIFFGTLTVLINLNSNYLIAPIILLLLNAVNWLIRMFVPGDRAFNIISWFSPLYHGTYSEHQFQAVLNGSMASAQSSALILIALSLIFIAISHLLIRNNDVLNFTRGDFDD